MQLSIVIVSYKVPTLLRRCLASIPVGSAEIIVVDNASGDETGAMVRSEFPAVRLIELDSNRGFSAAVNIGVAAATGDALLLLNPDARLLDGSPNNMIASLETHARAAIVGFRQLDERGNFQLAFGGEAKVFSESLRFLVQHGLDRGYDWLGRAIDAWADDPRTVPWVAGSSLLVRRSAFLEVGGFDEAFFLYFEDIDFCMRVGERGHRVVYDPTVTLVHHRGQSATKSAAQARASYRESQALYWERYGARSIAPVVRSYVSLRGLVDSRQQ